MMMTILEYFQFELDLIKSVDRLKTGEAIKAKYMFVFN